MFRPSSRRIPADPYDVLGVAEGSDVETILEARRSLAKQMHPDAGGSVESMQRLNAAADAALAAARTPVGSGPKSAFRPPSGGRPNATGGPIRHDHPSFTIEALPAEAFEGVLIAAAELGDVADDDPPYMLEVVMSTPPAWCRLELVPDAGSATVSITTARVPGHPTPDVYDVRDAWIAALNRLDWSDLGQRPPL